jgi:predicted MFS family arabinose efflux permease
LSHAGPQTAGSVSGALSTAQQVGNAIGVAITGVVFYGLLPRGYRAAFGSSVAEMGLLLLSVAALALIIPRPRPRPGGEG